MLARRRMKCAESALVACIAQEIAVNEKVAKTAHKEQDTKETRNKVAVDRLLFRPIPLTSSSLRRRSSKKLRMLPRLSPTKKRRRSRPKK